MEEMECFKNYLLVCVHGKTIVKKGIHTCHGLVIMLTCCPPTTLPSSTTSLLQINGAYIPHRSGRISPNVMGRSWVVERVGRMCGVVGAGVGFEVGRKGFKNGLCPYCVLKVGAGVGFGVGREGFKNGLCPYCVLVDGADVGFGIGREGFKKGLCPYCVFLVLLSLLTGISRLLSSVI